MTWGVAIARAGRDRWSESIKVRITTRYFKIRNTVLSKEEETQLATKKLLCVDNTSYLCITTAMAVCFAGQAACLTWEKQETLLTRQSLQFASFVVITHYPHIRVPHPSCRPWPWRRERPPRACAPTRSAVPPFLRLSVLPFLLGCLGCRLQRHASPTKSMAIAGQLKRIRIWRKRKQYNFGTTIKFMYCWSLKCGQSSARDLLIVFQSQSCLR